MLGELLWKLIIFIVISLMFMVPAYSGWFENASKTNYDMVASFIDFKLSLDTAQEKIQKEIFVDEKHIIKAFSSGDATRPKTKCKPLNPAKKELGCICICDIVKGCGFERLDKCNAISSDFKETYTIQPRIMVSKALTQTCDIIKEEKFLIISDCRTIE